MDKFLQALGLFIVFSLISIVGIFYEAFYLGQILKNGQ